MTYFFQDEFGAVINVAHIIEIFVSEKPPFQVVADLSDGTVKQITVATEDRDGSMMKLKDIFHEMADGGNVVVSFRKSFYPDE